MNCHLGKADLPFWSAYVRDWHTAIGNVIDYADRLPSGAHSRQVNGLDPPITRNGPANGPIKVLFDIPCRFCRAGYMTS